MNQSEYHEMYELESHYWWFVARRRLVRRFVQEIANGSSAGTIVDVGCGTGINQKELASFGDWYGVDSSWAALSLSQKRGVADLAQTEIEKLALASESADLLVALDVLEHVENDRDAIKELWRILKPNGRILLTVPAYQFLWSEHDEALHHKRRYVASEVRTKLTRAGFEVERISYFITSLFLPILLVRFWQTVFKKSVYPKTSHIILPGWLNSILVALLGFESFLLRKINLPFGVSIICVARKGENALERATAKK